MCVCEGVGGGGKGAGKGSRGGADGEGVSVARNEGTSFWFATQSTFNAMSSWSVNENIRFVGRHKLSPVFESAKRREWSQKISSDICSWAVVQTRDL